MWKEILELTPDRQKVIAKLGAQGAAKELNRSELPMVLAQIERVNCSYWMRKSLVLSIV